MPKYLIHCCNNRMWYVKEFLIPSMINQGISSDDIFIYQDKNEIGNLRAFVDSCNKLVVQCRKTGVDGVWHLQDDVVICKDFAERTKQYDEGIVCGFTCMYDDNPTPGKFKLFEEKMWFSFPCIRIPTSILTDFVNWANVNLWQSKFFNVCVRKNKSDDLIFREWLYDNYFNESELNLAPNLVNHIDTLIGGTVANMQRDSEQNTMSLFWEDDSIIDNLKKALDEYQNI